MSNSNADEPPAKHTTHPPPPPPPSLSSLPDEIVLRCIALVPRSYHLNLSWVSKNLRSLVRSPELNRLRSLPKSSLYVCFRKKYNDPNVHWFILRPIEEKETSTKTEYQLVPNPTPFPSPPNYGSSTVAVGSKIFFVGGFRKASSDLWILDTRSGNITQGPSMTVPRKKCDAAVGVIDGKIYFIGGSASDREPLEEIQVEVFDLKSETWKLAGQESVRKLVRCSASVEGKLYMVEYEETNVYNPRECEGERLVRMVSQTLSEGGRKDKFTDMARRVCVVEDVLFAFFSRTGLMWLDTKLNVWRRLLGHDGNELPFISHVDAMSEYDGRLVGFYDIISTDGLWGVNEVDITLTKNVQCILVSHDRSGDRICGTIDWSGIVGTIPFCFNFLHCVAVSE